MVTVMVGYVGEVYYTFSDSFSSFYEEVKFCGKSIELHIFGLTPFLILVMAARNGFLAFWGCYKALRCVVTSTKVNSVTVNTQASA